MGKCRFSVRVATWFAATTAVIACGSEAPQAPEKTGQTQSALFTNGGFETGTAGNPPGAPWAVQTFLNPGITVQTPQTLAGLNLATGGTARTVILNAAGGPGSQVDPDLGAGASLRWPRYGNHCALVNQRGNNRDVNSLSQTMTVAAADVDPNDGQVHIRFAVAPVLQNPAHTAVEQPYYFVLVADVTTNTILYSDFNLSGSGASWKKVNAGAPNEIDYTDWQLVDVAPGASGIAIGDQVTLQVFGAGCSLGAHFGEVYVDGVGTSTVPGIFVEGTGPAQTNAGTNITYTLRYKNGGAAAETGVRVTLTTPPNTTFQAVSAAGLTCVTPAAGATGTVTCTVGSLAAGASGSFTVTVNINASTTGTLVEHAYQIQSTQETALVGPAISTLCGCTKDSDCPAGNWCDETAATCNPKLANAAAIPSDPPHTNPTLSGTCTVPAGTLVCVSAVCDTGDSECGYANGDGPCTAGNGALVCRSGTCSANGKCMPAGGCNVDADCSSGHWCSEGTHACTATLANGSAVPSDPAHANPTLNGACSAAAGALVCTSGVCDTKDNECGLANGDGPCTAGNGTVVCRSGACSASGTCEPAGGCNIDADCPIGHWCNESLHGCAATLANGSPVPTDSAHTSPTLNGTCTAAAGALVCTSGVCDTNDNECGYATGDGPCASDGGSAVCRSGACSTNGKCEPAGGCDVDADCSSNRWCDESMHTCAMKVPNGGAVPSDPAHANPTLSGTCTVQAGALVCASSVCDTSDNACGLANGDGPCSPVDGGSAVCRSGACNAGGTCGPPGGADAGNDGGATDAGSGDVIADGAGAGDATAEDAGAEGGAGDGGAADAGALDATAGDSGTFLDATAPDAGQDAEAVNPPVAGVVEGGGCGCVSAGTPTRDTPATLGGLLLVGVLAGRRRRARRSA